MGNVTDSVLAKASTASPWDTVGINGDSVGSRDVQSAVWSAVQEIKAERKHGGNVSVNKDPSFQPQCISYFE